MPPSSPDRDAILAAIAAKVALKQDDNTTSYNTQNDIRLAKLAAGAVVLHR